MRTHLYQANNRTISVFFNGGLTTAVMSDNEGNIAKGHALHQPDDAYDRKFGEKLAIVRAYSRYFRKVEKKLINISNKGI